jgi:hypothetical protein
LIVKEGSCQRPAEETAAAGDHDSHVRLNPAASQEIPRRLR